MIQVYFTLSLLLYFSRKQIKTKQHKKLQNLVSGFCFLIFPYFVIQCKNQEITNSVMDWNSVQCKCFQKTADQIRTKIHLSQHPYFSRHEYGEQACLEWSFLPACSFSSKSSPSWEARLQTSVFNREHGPVLSPFKNLITLLASATSCGNEFPNLITGVIWQLPLFISKLLHKTCIECSLDFALWEIMKS